MTIEILEGNKARLSTVFTRTTDGAAVDPADVYLKYQIGEAAIVTLTYLIDVSLIRDSTGNYHADIDLTPGVLYWEWRGTGANQAADEGYFTVTASRFG